MTSEGFARALGSGLLAGLVLVMGGARAQDGGLLQCRKMADAALRLACYDALPLQPLPISGPVASAPLTSVSQKPDQFGQDAQAMVVMLDSIESRIAGRFDGWQAKDRLTLANGQVWQINDGSTGVLNLLDPKVTIRRGALGAFYLEIEGTNRSPRVKRVQ
jgi:hypothetical protein